MNTYQMTYTIVRVDGTLDSDTLAIEALHDEHAQRQVDACMGCTPGLQSVTLERLS